MQILIQWVWDEAQEPAFLDKLQADAALVQGPHFEQQSPREVGDGNIKPVVGRVLLPLCDPGTWNRARAQ